MLFLAKTSKCEKAPVDVDAINSLAESFAQSAECHVDYLQGQQRDPNIVTRAIRYIEHHHRRPWGERIYWFDATLEILIELACSNTQATITSKLFYRDLEEGIRQARADFD
jgi:hypothetical protein